MTTESGLTQKQHTFINAYLGNGENATEAYKQAGYRVKNDNVAAPEASKLLRNPKVSQEITRLKAHELAKQAKKQETGSNAGLADYAACTDCQRC